MIYFLLFILAIVLGLALYFYKQNKDNIFDDDWMDYNSTYLNEYGSDELFDLDDEDEENMDYNGTYINEYTAVHMTDTHHEDDEYNDDDKRDSL